MAVDFSQKRKLLELKKKYQFEISAAKISRIDENELFDVLLLKELNDNIVSSINQFYEHKGHTKNGIKSVLTALAFTLKQIVLTSENDEIFEEQHILDLLDNYYHSTQESGV
jgi:hypothetical protein